MRSRGFGFVSFADENSVTAVLNEDHYVDGKMVGVSIRMLR